MSAIVFIVFMLGVVVGSVIAGAVACKAVIDSWKDQE